MTLNLFKEIARTGYHSSIITTYSVDPAFYDGSIQYRLRSHGCDNNILMTDAGMLKKALLSTPEGFTGAGCRYAVAPIKVNKGCFHPKINLRLGADRAALIIGSANATAAGWGSNQEIGTAILWRNNPDDAHFAPLIHKAYSYLDSWLSETGVEHIEFKRNYHRRYSPWLHDIAPNMAPVQLPDGTLIDILFERGSGDESIMAKFARLLNGQVPQRLLVVSPYWDNKLQGLKELHDILQKCPTFIALHPQTNEFPTDALSPIEARFLSLKHDKNGHRFLHAKIILVETKEFDHVLYGSANCSDDALGGISLAARNAETSIYRRLPAGTIRDTLGIDLTKEISREDIQQSRYIPEEKSSSASLSGGCIELHNDMIIWSPPVDVEGHGAQMMISDDRLPMEPLPAAKFGVSLEKTPHFPLIVRILLTDGRMTDPMIVHDNSALRRASPGNIDRRLQRAFDRIEAGEEDLIDLAQDAYIIFGPEDATHRRGMTARTEREAVTQDESQQFDTPEAFRAAIELKPMAGETHRFSTDDPGLIELLRIIMRGIADIGGKDAEKRRAEEENFSLLDGENEDGDENSENEPVIALSREDAAPPAKERLYTAAQIKLRKKHLLKALDTFENLVSAKESVPPSTRLLAQTAFALNLMLYACKKEHKMESGRIIRLMEFFSDSPKERELSFSIRAGRLLQSIWVGGGSSQPLIKRIPIDTRTEAPDDVFYLVIISRWAITRAFLAVPEKSSAKALQERLAGIAVKLYRETAMFGFIKEEREAEIISQLDHKIGFSNEESVHLLTQCRAFIKQCSQTA